MRLMYIRDYCRPERRTYSQMFVDGMGVGSVVRGFVATGFRCFGGVCPTALGALEVGINVGH